jgi:hypothetical protein
VFLPRGNGAERLGRGALRLVYDFAAERSSYLLVRQPKLAESVNELAKPRAQDFSETI